MAAAPLVGRVCPPPPPRQGPCPLGAPSQARGALQATRAATQWGAVAGEWELYKRESTFYSRTVQIMQVITKSFQQEWDTYRAEWNAEPMVTAAEQQAATLAEALKLAAAEDAAAGAADDGEYEDGLLDDGMRPGGCWGVGAIRQDGSWWSVRGCVASSCAAHCSVCPCEQPVQPVACWRPCTLPVNACPPPVCRAAGGYHPVQPGEQFKGGRYTALHFLGQGHYATVWMMRDEATGQEVAMKVGWSGWVCWLAWMAGWVGLGAGWVAGWLAGCPQGGQPPG